MQLYFVNESLYSCFKQLSTSLFLVEVINDQNLKTLFFLNLSQSLGTLLDKWQQHYRFKIMQSYIIYLGPV